MRDPIEELESFNPGMPMNPLPAAEVRRRGTRLRRRNTALAVAGTVAAITVVAVPVAALAGHDTNSSVPPAAPTHSWLQQVPDDFPLTDGMPAPVDARADYDPQVTTVCASAAWSPNGAVSTEQAVYTDRSEGGTDRTLALYADDSEAEAALTRLDVAVSSCAAGTEGRFPSAELLSSDLGEQSVVYANRYTDGGDLSLVQVVRVGNAILQADAYSTGAAPEQTAATVRSATSPVIAAMCAFSATGCGDTATDEDTAAQVVPDDFPLADGYPADGATGPSRALAPIDLAECGSAVDVPAHTDLVRAGFHAVGDDRERQLVTFADPDQAQAYVESVIGLYEDCITSREGDRTQLVQALTDVSGYDAAGGAHIRWERDGEPLPGVETVAVVRVGSSVLLSTITSDEGVGPDGGAIQEQSLHAFDSIDPVVEAMGDLT